MIFYHKINVIVFAHRPKYFFSIYPIAKTFSDERVFRIAKINAMICLKQVLKIH